LNKKVKSGSSSTNKIFFFLFLLDDGDATESVYIFTVSLIMIITIMDAGDSMELA
jgi:hypothetical protein